MMKIQPSFESKLCGFLVGCGTVVCVACVCVLCVCVVICSVLRVCVHACVVV